MSSSLTEHRHRAGTFVSLSVLQARRPIAKAPSHSRWDYTCLWHYTERKSRHYGKNYFQQTLYSWISSHFIVTGASRKAVTNPFLSVHQNDYGTGPSPRYTYIAVNPGRPQQHATNICAKKELGGISMRQQWLLAPLIHNEPQTLQTLVPTRTMI